MDSLVSSPILLAVASSMVGLLPLLITITVDQLEKRSNKARRDANLNYLNQRITFVTSWFNAQKEISDEEQLKRIQVMMADELRDIYTEFANAILEVEKEAQQRQELMQRVKNMNFIKRLLLLYKPFNVRGWLFHALFYMCVAPLLVSFGFVIYKYTQTQVWFKDIPVDYLYVGIGMAALAIVFHWLGRGSAKGVEENMAILDRKTSPLGKSASL